MGALYLARDTNPNTNRLVALKLLNATLDSTELRDRFAREARALAALNHPNIVDIYDSGEFQGSPFIVMEYVRGETLAERIKRKAPMSLGQKLKLMVELCSGLAHAHEAGIIHRDIKPANLMVDRGGHLKILDFGIARVAEGTRFGGQMTQVNMRIGTPGYMSPEQIEGGAIDRRSDIFAAGAVCYELLAYREAFTGANTRQVENQVLESRPVRLSSLVPDLDPTIEQIVDKALAKDPNDRYQSAAAFEEALERQRWKLGPEEMPVQTVRTTPSPSRDSGPRTRDSRADAAYERSLAVYEQGAVEAARRFAIEALAEDPDHQDARAFIERLGANLWPPPPPSSALRTTGAATVLADGSAATGTYDPSAPTVLSTATPHAGTLPATGAAGVLARHRKTLQIAGIGVGVFLVVAVAVLLVVSLWPGGPLLTVTRPQGGIVWTTGISCGTKDSDCTANIPDGETVQLNAEADDGYTFAGFSGDCTSRGRVTMTRPSTCVATFNPLPKEAEKIGWALTLVKPAHGMIVGPGGIRCGSVDTACSVQFGEGTEIKLSAYADANFAFRGFTGDCSPKGETIMRGARTCAATFVPEQRAAKPPPVPPPTRARASDGTARGSGTGATIDSFPSNLPGGNTADPLAPPPKRDEAARVAPPISAEELAKKDIQKLLEEYRDAYERMDLNGIQRTFPSAPVKNLKSGFSGYNSLKYALEGSPEFVDVDPSRGMAVVKAKFLLTPDAKVGSQAPYRREETFKLELQKGAWVIREWSPKMLK
jgi:serine/threonine protein kinase